MGGFGNSGRLNEAGRGMGFDGLQLRLGVGRVGRAGIWDVGRWDELSGMCGTDRVRGGWRGDRV